MPGKVMAHNPCLSGGTLEIFLRAASAGAAGGRHRRQPDRPRPDRGRGGARLRHGATPTTSRTAPPPSSSRRTVATRSTPLTAALRRGVGYVGLVASPKRGAAVLDGLDVDDSMKARVVTPAGLDIGARTPEEVALSILADIIARRPRPSARPVGDGSPPAPTGRRPGVRDDRGGRRRRAAPRSRRTAALVLWDRVPARLRRRPDALHRRRDGGPGRPRRDVAAVRQALDDVDYIADLGLATALFCAVRLHQPLLLEGEAGSARRRPAKAIAEVLDTPLVRLQCYEGITAAEALYEWNYPRQLLAIRTAEAGGTAVHEQDLFTLDYLVGRPLLRAIQHPGPRPTVLLIDEIDRADDEFEAFLFELLAESAVTIPELGTIRATHPPVVVLTSNRTRDLHDALKRRCLYHWIDYPPLRTAVEIVRRRVPSARAPLVEQVGSADRAAALARRAEAARHRRGDRLDGGARGAGHRGADARRRRPHRRVGAQVPRGHRAGRRAGSRLGRRR